MYRTAIDKLNNSKTIEALLDEKVVNLDLTYDLAIFKPSSLKIDGQSFDIDLSLNAQIPVRSVIKKVEEDLFYFEHYIVDKSGSEIFVFDDQTNQATVEELSKIYLNIENSKSFNLNCVAQLFNHTIEADFQKQVYANSQRKIISSEEILEDFLSNLSETVDRLSSIKYPDGSTKEEYTKLIDDIIKSSTGISSANHKFLSEKLKIDSDLVNDQLFRHRVFKSPVNIADIIEHARDVLNNFSKIKDNNYQMDTNIEAAELKAIVALCIFERKNASCTVIDHYDDLFDQIKKINIDKNGQLSINGRLFQVKPEENRSIFTIRAKPNVSKVYYDTEQTTQSILNVSDGELIPNANFSERIVEKAIEFKNENNSNDPLEFIAFIKNKYAGRQEVSRILYQNHVEEAISDTFKNNRYLEHTL